MKTIFLLLAFSFPLLLFSQVDLDRKSDSKPSEKEYGPNDVVFIDENPKPINLEDIKRAIGYPSLAKQNHIQGRVIIRVQVDEKGNYIKHILLRNPGQPLSDAVEKHIPKLKFSPGVLAGNPIKFWITIPFNFKLMMSPEEETWAKMIKTREKVYFSLDEALAAPNPKAVKVIYLNDAGLKTFPMEVFRFPNLTILQLSANEIESIPAEIGNLKHLQFINLSHNRITSISEALWSIPSLTSVNIGSNYRLPKPERKKLNKKHKEKLFPLDEKGKVKWD